MLACDQIPAFAGMTKIMKFPQKKVHGISRVIHGTEDSGLFQNQLAPGFHPVPRLTNAGHWQLASALSELFVYRSPRDQTQGGVSGR